MKLTILQVRKGGLPPLIPKLIDRGTAGVTNPSLLVLFEVCFSTQVTEKRAIIYRPPTTGHYC